MMRGRPEQRPLTSFCLLFQSRNSWRLLVTTVADEACESEDWLQKKKKGKTNRAFNQTEKHLSRSSTLIFLPLLLLLLLSPPPPLSTAPLLWCSSEVNQNLLPTLPRCSSSTCNIVLCMFTMLGVNYIEYTHTHTHSHTCRCKHTHTHTSRRNI